MEHHFTVDEKSAGNRLDKWLCIKLPKFSRAQIKALLDDGRVLVNRRRVVIAGWELEPHDVVEIRIPPRFDKERKPTESESPQHKEFKRPERRAHSSVGASIDRHIARKIGHRPSPSQQEMHGRKAGNRRLHIYHEDKDIIIVEKPAGILSVPSEGRGDDRENLLNEIKSYLKRRHPNYRHSFVSPLHRLDVETSGIMVFALSKNGQKLDHQFLNHSIRREYAALVHGRMEDSHGLIVIPLEKGEFGHGRKVRPAVHGQGKRAVTEFRVKERYQHATLVELNVRTGRTHQIRVHLAEKGFPLIGDKLYVSPGTSIAHDFGRHALHAHVLGFKHPATGQKLTFHSPLPRDMRELIDKLRPH